MNPALAWSLGNGREGRVRILFPFQLPWCCHESNERPSAHCRFRVLQYRKERGGFRHESLVLHMVDGSICRIERMGDPTARLNALHAHGSVAHDFLQCLKPEEYANAPPDTSEVIATIQLPHEVDMSRVLTICRAIHEGETTRNYTLFGSNCYFFSWAILCCLTRLANDLDYKEAHQEWIQKLIKAVDLPAARTQPLRSRELPSRTTISPLMRTYTALYSGDKESTDKLLRSVQSIIRSHTGIIGDLRRTIEGVLWHSALDVELGRFAEETVRSAWLEVLRGQLDVPRTQTDLLISPYLGASIESFGNEEQCIEFLKKCCMVALIELLDTRVGPVSPGAPRNKEEATLLSKDVETPVSLASSASFSFTMDYRGVHASHPMEVTTMAQSMTLFVIHIQHLVYELLNLLLFCFMGVLLFDCRIEPILCIAIEDELDRIASKIEHHSTMDAKVLRDLFYELRVLQEKKGEIVWSSNESLWGRFCKEVGYNLPSSADSYQATELLQLTTHDGVENKTEAITMPELQGLLLRRITQHAKLLERLRVGSFLRVRDQLQDRLSQVWALIRNDGFIGSDNTEGITSINENNIPAAPGSSATGTSSSAARAWQEPLQNTSGLLGAQITDELEPNTTHPDAAAPWSSSIPSSEPIGAAPATTSVWRGQIVYLIQQRLDQEPAPLHFSVIAAGGPNQNIETHRWPTRLSGTSGFKALPPEMATQLYSSQVPFGQISIDPSHANTDVQKWQVFQKIITAGWCIFYEFPADPANPTHIPTQGAHGVLFFSTSQAPGRILFKAFVNQLCPASFIRGGKPAGPGLTRTPNPPANGTNPNPAPQKPAPATGAGPNLDIGTTMGLPGAGPAGSMPGAASVTPAVGAGIPPVTPPTIPDAGMVPGAGAGTGARPHPTSTPPSPSPTPSTAPTPNPGGMNPALMHGLNPANAMAAGMSGINPAAVPELGAAGMPGLNPGVVPGLNPAAVNPAQAQAYRAMNQMALARLGITPAQLAAATPVQKQAILGQIQQMMLRLRATQQQSTNADPAVGMQQRPPGMGGGQPSLKHIQAYIRQQQR